jgi:cyanophycin synthetase
VLPFEASRRLTGANLFFAGTGAQLETTAITVDTTLLDAWWRA